MKDRRGEHLFCDLPDGTIASLPSWMFDSACSQFSLGPPLVALEALVELRDLLDALQPPGECDRASLEVSPKEVLHETKEA